MKTVLIIEDNLDIRENTAEILEFFNFKVITAESGKAGLSAAFRSKPDLILCDIMMPGLDGYEVIKQLKRNPSTCAIPFIYLTASGERSDVRIAMEMGASGYVRKPFEGRQLIAEIQKCLKQVTHLSSSV
ncbi:MAG: response regulator [Chryseosolibacter sp.]